MRFGLDDFAARRDGVTVPRIWIALALSLLVHAALMWEWLPRIRLPSPDMDDRGKAGGSLVVRLTPPPAPPAAPPPSRQTQPPPPPPPPARPAARSAARPPAPPVIALNAPAPKAAPSPVPVPATPAPTVAPSSPLRPPAEADLAAYIAARRRARGDSATPSTGSSADVPAAETDNARSNRLAAANLGTQRKQTFGYDPSQGGGVFQLVRVGYTDAEFLFFGWNKDIRRNTKQLIEVKKGNNPDTRIAIVRKMIAIIREYEQEDFLWESRRLGRNLMLSARARDTAGLEDFLMHEFFDDPNRPPPP